MRKKIIILLASIMVLGSSNLVQASSDQMENTAQETIIDSRKDDIRYVYEVRDGKLYKRLYNYSKDKWVGDWILCI